VRQTPRNALMNRRLAAVLPVCAGERDVNVIKRLVKRLESVVENDMPHRGRPSARVRGLMLLVRRDGQHDQGVFRDRSLPIDHRLRLILK
jgi:hypothetical protein